MGLEKAIEHGKEHRKPFLYEHKNTRAKSIDCTCRNHGTCDWCKNNRLISSARQNQKCAEQEREYKKEQ